MNTNHLAASAGRERLTLRPHHDPAGSLSEIAQCTMGPTSPYMSCDSETKVDASSGPARPCEKIMCYEHRAREAGRDCVCAQV